MSNQEPNLETQKRRHKGPLFGMALGLIFVAGLFVWWLTYEVAESDPPAGSDVQIDGRTGEPEDDESLNVPGDGEPADFDPDESVPAVNAPAEDAPANPVPSEPSPVVPVPVE